MVGEGICLLWRQKGRHFVQSWRHVEVASLLKIDEICCVVFRLTLVVAFV